MESSTSQVKQATFQERIVKQLLRYAGCAIAVSQLKQDAYRKYGSHELDFIWFNQECHSFPVTLLSKKLPYTADIKLADIYGKGRFKKLGWWKAYQDAVEDAGVDLTTERAAFFFNLPHAKDAFLMVVHNQPVQNTDMASAEYRDEEPWPRTTFPIGRTGVVAVLEAFPSFMQTVGKSWVDTL